MIAPFDRQDSVDRLRSRAGVVLVTLALTPDESYVGLFRFTGPDGNPRAPGSHALQGMTFQVAAVNLAYALALESSKVVNSAVYRQPTPDQIGQPVEGEPQFISRRAFATVTRPF